MAKNLSGPLIVVFPAKRGHAILPFDNNTRVIKDKVMELLILFVRT